jgi:hypothetical protein
VNPTDIYTPPSTREWLHLGTERLLSHARFEPDSLIPEEAAAQYEMVACSQWWRVQKLGYDPVGETAERWLTFIGRIAAFS